MMKSDREKAAMWSTEHWALAKCACVCVVILGLILTGLDIMTPGAAFTASMLGVVYVLLLTRNFTRHRKNKSPRPANVSES